MVTTEDMLEAYFDCRRHKRSTASAIVYEMDYEPRIIELVRRINARQYQPGKSICFVVTRPRYREVFAASFEDRIVHHWIALRLEPLFERTFNDRTYNCRKGKGQLYGIRHLQWDMWECSKGYTTDCWVMKLDLKGFFMSIDKAMLASCIDKFIISNYKGYDVEDLRYICRTVIMHCPEKNCEKHSNDELWQHLSADKSLFTNGEGKGVAIGNLFAQHFANFYLNELDWYLDSICKHHGRYVDDFYVMDNDKEKPLALMPKIRQLLSDWKLRLNEKKFYIQHYSKGVAFTGTIVKPYRTYINNNTISNFRTAIFRLNRAKDIPSIRKAIQSVNSYLGLMRQCNEYGMRRKMLRLIDPRIWKYAYIKGNHNSLKVRWRYTREWELKRKIKDGDY